MPILSHRYDSTPKKSCCKWDSNLGSSALEADALPLGQRGGSRWVPHHLATEALKSDTVLWSGDEAGAGERFQCVLSVLVFPLALYKHS